MSNPEGSSTRETAKKERNYSAILRAVHEELNQRRYDDETAAAIIGWMEAQNSVLEDSLIIDVLTAVANKLNTYLNTTPKNDLEKVAANAWEELVVPQNQKEGDGGVVSEWRPIGSGAMDPHGGPKPLPGKILD